MLLLLIVIVILSFDVLPSDGDGLSITTLWLMMLSLEVQRLLVELSSTTSCLLSYAISRGGYRTTNALSY